MGGSQDQIPAGVPESKDQLSAEPFSTSEKIQITEAIQKKYAAVAETSATGFFSYPVGRAGATLLGYNKRILETIPEPQMQSFCGVGNPFSIHPIPERAHVLDIGCGAGIDCYVASTLVGEEGKVTGVDVTAEMVTKAKSNMQVLGAKNIEIHMGDGVRLPLEDKSVDVVISNGVINLAPCKLHLFHEIHRVMKPGGRLQFADIILEKQLPPHLAIGVESWSQ